MDRGDRKTAWIGLVCLGLCAPAQAAIIQLQERADVSASVVRLRDVARVVDADPQAVRRYEQLILAPAPPAGRTTRIEYDAIRRRLESLGVNLADVEFTGSAAVTVQGGSPAPGPITPVKAERLEPPAPPPRSVPPQTLVSKPAPRVSPAQRQRAEQLLVGRFRQQFRSAKAETVPHIGFEIPAGDVATILGATPDQLDFQAPNLRIGGPQPVDVLVTTPEVGVRLVHLEATVTLKRRVLAPRSALPRGHLVQEADLDWVEADLQAAGVESAQDLVGRETVRAIKPGEPFKPADTTGVPLVKSNDLVTARVRRPGITVKRPFKATSQGALGETVMLVSLDDARERVQAVVTGFHEVEIVDPVGAANPPGVEGGRVP